MSERNTLCVVSMAAGGLYGPFPDEKAARAWGDRERPGQIWNVVPLTKVSGPDLQVTIGFERREIEFV